MIDRKEDSLGQSSRKTIANLFEHRLYLIRIAKTSLILSVLRRRLADMMALCTLGIHDVLSFRRRVLPH